MARAPSAVLALAALVLIAAPAARAKPGKSGGFGGSSFGGSSGGGFGSFGGSGFGKPAMGTPVRTGGTATGYPAMGGAGSGSFKPAPGQAMPTMPVAAKPIGPAAGGAAGMGAGMMGGGMRRSSSIMPFAMGAFAGTAAFALLSRDPSARCDGFRVNCYQRLCEQAAANCPGGIGAGLQPARCPESRYSECWETKDRSFLCVGVPRPSANLNMDAFCRNPGGANGTDTRGVAGPAALGAAAYSGKAGPNGVELVPSGTPSMGGAGPRAVGAALVAGAAALALLLA